MFKKEWMIDMMEQKTILIVDDENMMREAVASYLEKQGYHVLQAETGTQALSLLEKETVSFVILDLMIYPVKKSVPEYAGSPGFPLSCSQPKPWKMIC